MSGPYETYEGSPVSRGVPARVNLLTVVGLLNCLLSDPAARYVGGA